MNTLGRLLSLLKDYRGRVVLVIFATIGVTVANLYSPWIIRTLISLFQENSSDMLEKIGWMSLILIGVYIVRAVFQFITSYVSHRVAWELVEKLRVSIYESMQKLSLRYYHDKQTGQLMSRIINDTEKLEPLLAHAVPDLIVNTLLFIGVAIILFTLNPRLTLYTLLPMPFIVLLALNFSRLVRPAFRLAQESIAELNALLQDNISGIKEIQIFTREKREATRVAKRAKTYTEDLLYALKLNALHYPAIEWFASIGTVIVLFFGGRQALQGSMPLEDIVAFLLYLGMFYQPIVVLARLNEGIQQALASSERIFEVLDTQPDLIEKASPIELKNSQGRIKFEDVHFSYIPNEPVLKGISFEVEPGKTLALVGPTGVGKTTIASLIPRFYDVKSGRVVIDDIDVRDLSLKSLREQISIVLQDVFLFNGTVKDNILYGNPHATDEEVFAAAQLANAHEFIAELPEGYNTHIGERGVKLSGGQKQRLSIARAILKNAPILILDEATSSVDTETEHLIQEALNKLMQDRTAIIIAHRLSTIKNADAIAVLQDGQIIQYGTHDELIKQDGMYRRLYTQQFANIA
ncbi:MAG: ABC transporter ATP-binding protein [Firmicutes bacterium]|nr:ABC transporter ATP-binding protein [Bacillota bacterium]